VEFFSLEEIERGLKKFKFRDKMPPWRIRAWLLAVEELRDEKSNPERA